MVFRAEVKRETRFNRYIVECKEHNFVTIMFAFVDLIDTLWNVKKVDIRNWNEDHSRFNRYIVECKGGIRAHRNTVVEWI